MIKSVHRLRFLLLLLLLFILSVSSSIYYYSKFTNLNNFIKGVIQYKRINSSDNNFKRLVYFGDGKSEPKLLLTDEFFAGQRKIYAIEGVVDLNDLREQLVTFNKIRYFILPYQVYIDLGWSDDYLIFNGKGELVTEALLRNVKIKEFSDKDFWGYSIVSLQENGVMVLSITQKEKQYYATFDITTGKLKSVSPNYSN